MGVLVNHNHEQVNGKQQNNQSRDDHDVQAIESRDYRMAREFSVKQERGNRASDNRNTLEHSVDDAKTVS